MKIAFFGTGEFSSAILQWILDTQKYDVKLVVSQPDKPIWRKKIITATPVKELAVKHNLSVLQPEKLRNNTEFFKNLNDLDLDFIVVVAYGKIVPLEVLEAPKYGCINTHGSILPAYRWASPIQESVKNGDTETWLTIMYMSEWMDEWDILKIQKCDINEHDTSLDIFNKFIDFGPSLLTETLEWVLDGSVKWQKQDESQVSYCGKISKADAEIDFTQSAQETYNKKRSYTPWPGIFTTYKWKKLAIEVCHVDNSDIAFDDDFHIGDVVELEQHEKQKIWVLCWSGILILEEVKLEWKKSMDINSFVNGNKDFLEYNFLSE